MRLAGANTRGGPPVRVLLSLVTVLTLIACGGQTAQLGGSAGSDGGTRDGSRIGDATHIGRDAASRSTESGGSSATRTAAASAHVTSQACRPKMLVASRRYPGA